MRSSRWVQRYKLLEESTVSYTEDGGSTSSESLVPAYSTRSHNPGDENL